MADDTGGGEVDGSRKKFSGGEEKAERGIRLIRARGLAELLALLRKAFEWEAEK